MPFIDQDYLRRLALARVNVGMLPAVPSDYDTKLDDDEEAQFQEWKSKYAPHDSGDDYDLRGAFKSGFTPDPDTGHFPDQYKKPNHPTFSDQSQYAEGGDRDKAGHWVDNSTYVPPKGMLDQAWLNGKAGDQINVGLLPATRASQDITASPSANVEPAEAPPTAGEPPSRYDMADKFVGVRDPQMSATSDTGATGWQDTAENAFANVPTTPSEMREAMGGMTGNPMVDYGVPFGAYLAKGAASQAAQLADTGEEARRGYPVSHPNTALLNAMTMAPLPGARAGRVALEEAQAAVRDLQQLKRAGHDVGDQLAAAVAHLQEVWKADPIAGVMQQQEQMKPERGGATFDSMERRMKGFFDPLQEPEPGTIGKIMKEQDAMGELVGGTNPRSREAHFDPLQEPPAQGTIGKIMEQQDMDPAHGRSFAGDINKAHWFDSLREPEAEGTIGKIMQEQDRMGGDVAKSLPDWQQGKPGEPGPLTMEKHFGVMQPLRGTPTEPRTTGDMSKTELGERIHRLQSDRDAATNKFDRDYYSTKIRELQGEIPTPDWTADPWSGGMLRFRRTENPSNIGFPFRQSRVTDPHPDEQGLSPPTNWPGKWTMTGGGKRWDWARQSKPGTPGSRTISDEAGHSAVGHAGHWTVGDPRDWGTRRFVWQQDTNRTRTPTPTPPGTTTNLMNAPTVALNAPRSMNSQEAMRRMVDKVREGDLPQDVKDRLFKQADAAWRARQERNMPSVITGLREHTPSPQSLGIPDPRFHPAPGVDVFAPRLGSSQFARKPTNVRVQQKADADMRKLRSPNPFDPEGERAFEGAISQAMTPPSDTGTGGQMRMFGLSKGMSPYSKPDRAIFKEQTPHERWDEFLRHPNTRKLENQAEGGINDSYEVAYEGDKDNTFFLKDITKHGYAGHEVAALDVGEMLGAEVLPAVQLGPKRLLTPWVKGKNFRDDPDGAKEAMKRMVPEIRDRNTMFEFLMADPDKHDGNYFVDYKSGKIVGIDYGTALKGDQYTMGYRSFYKMLRKVFDASTPVDKAAIKDVVSKEEQVVAHFKQKANASDREIRGLQDRFKILRDLANDGGDVTYKDFDEITRYGR